MEPPRDFQDKENAARGCLKFNDKMYPVFDGHNTIGRHPKAVVNIKNLNISHQHAVITVVDKNTHFISDFNSSNGTVVDNKKLSPLKLYLLDNGASIKFADVFCTYKKLEADETILDRSEASQDFSERFYATNTQTIQLENSNEMILNEMPTQIVGTRSLSIHEMPTQLFSFNSSRVQESLNEAEDNSSSDSIDFITMQKTSESQMFALNKKIVLNSDVKAESVSVQLSEESGITPVKLNDKKKILSDSERSTPDIIDKESPQNDSETDEEASASQICPVRTGIKNGIDSDSDTDDYSPQKSYLADRRRSKYVLSDDEETDIEDNNKMMNESDMVPNTQSTPQKCENSEKNQNEEPSFTENFKLQVSKSVDERVEDKNLHEGRLEDKNEEQGEKNEEQRTEKNQGASSSVEEIKSAVAEDHIYCRSFGEDVNQSHISKKMEKNEGSDFQFESEIVENAKSVCKDKENKKGTSEESALFESMKTVTDATAGECDDVKPGTSASSGNYLQKNQDVEADSKEETTQKLVENEEVPSVSEENHDNEDELTKSDSQNVERESKGQDTSNVDDVFDQPTQNIDFNFVNESAKTTQGEKSTNIGTEEEKSNVDNISDKLKKTNLDFAKEKEVEDIYLQSTQEMSISNRPPVDRSMIYDDDIYLHATQGMNEINELIKASQSIDTTSEGAQTNGGDKGISEENNASDFTKAHDFVLPLPPDKEKDDNFLIPSLPNINKNPAIEDDDELFLPPTQALELLHKEDETSVPSSETLSDKEPEKVEDQLEMLFASQSDHMFVATQQLVDVLEDKNESVIEDSMMENDLKKSQFHSIESIREILDESMSEDDDNKVREKEERSKKDADSEKTKAEEKVLKERDDDTGESTKKQKDKEKIENKTKVEKNISSENEKEESQTNSTCGSSNNSRFSNKKKNKVVAQSSVQSTKKLEEKKMTTRSSKVEPVKEVEEKTNKTRKTKKISESYSGAEEIKEQKTEESSKKFVKEGNIKRTRSNVELSTENEKSSVKKIEQADQDTEGTVSVRRTRRNAESRAQINTKSNENSQIEIDKAKKETNVQIQSKMKQENKENNTRASKRKADFTLGKTPVQKDPETDNSEPETNKKMKKKETISIASNVSKKSNEDQKGSSTRMLTRKRSINTDDEFQSKILKTDSVERSPGRSTRSNKFEVPVITETVMETPTTRKSTRTKKSKSQEDDMISISSSASSITSEVATVPSTSSASNPSPPTKRGRKLSANSRALKNEKEKIKGKEEDTSVVTKTRRSAMKQMSPILATPERSKRVQKPKVAFTMMDSPELESLIRQLGGSVVDTVDACTVLVTGNVKRSEKLLRAVGQAKPICSPQWLLTCKKASKFLDPWDYVLVDEEAEKKWDFSLQESLQRSSKTKLLENYTFQIMATAATDVLKGAIESCGGKCVNRNLSRAGTDNLVIVASNDQKNKFAKIVKDNPNIKVVEPEAIFDGTLRQEFRFDLHQLI